MDLAMNHGWAACWRRLAVVAIGAGFLLLEAKVFGA